MSHTIRTLIRELIAENFGADELRQKEQNADATKIIKNLGWDIEKKLGQGQNGIVFLASNDAGQHVAIKLTTQDEAEEYQKVKDVRKKLPAELQKHMPIVHFVKTLANKPAGFVNAIGVEVLKPLPKQVSDRLVKPTGTSPAAMQDILKDEEIVVKILRAAAEKMSASAVAIEVGKLIDLRRLLSTVEGKTLQWKMPTDYTNDQIRKEIQMRGKDWADREFSLKARRFALVVGSWAGKLAEEAGVRQTLAKMFAVNMSIMVVKQLRSTAMGIGNPKDPVAQQYWDSSIFSTLPGAENLPGAASLGKALEAMAELGLSWRDLHQDNVMMRPSTGDIVVSDFGNFNVT